MSDAFNERLRMIRFRRKKERTRFRDELRIIPKWLFWLCLVLYVLALTIGLLANIHGFQTGREIFPDESLRSEPVLSCFALAGVITAAGFVVSCLFFMLGYVYRDAKRRGMNPALWTLLVLILSGGSFFIIGLIIYLLVREPLPYSCPQCATTVNARFNFCPNCKYNLHPACPQCQREVSDDDKFCPYCATELHHGPKPLAEGAPSHNPAG
jgi:RNA polymerase subunit RPABC4/transcription elongation factor Spt4